MTATDDEPAGPVVYALGSGATVADLVDDHWYVGEINGVVPYGVFVDLNERISGLIHESNLSRDYEVGEEVIVTLESIQPNGDVAFEAGEFEDFERVPFDPEPDPTPIGEISVDAGTVTVEGRITQINQTGGPTVFSVCDGHHVLPCAGFEAAGVRAYPNVDRGDLVRLLGTPQHHDGGMQLEIDAVSILEGGEANEVNSRLDRAEAARTNPPSPELLVHWDVLERMQEDIADLARSLRHAILHNRPVHIRHHADGDGMCAAVPLTLALERFAAEVHLDSSAPDHLVDRSPSKAPYYEMEDATRDLNKALRARDRHGQPLPHLLMLDNGSTEEDVPAYRNLAHYDIPISVVDHHHPDREAVRDLLDHHVNPYLVGEDYRVTTGMICVELARMIDPDLTSSLAHIPAVAGLADRSSANAMNAYLDQAADAGYDPDELSQIGDALDYAAHWLQFRRGERVVRDILGVSADPGPHRELVTLLSDEAQQAITTQVNAATPYLQTDTLANGATINQLDVEKHAHRFRYPAPGKTTGAIHDAHVDESGDPTITLGYGPDFCVLRSDGVRLDIPAIVADLKKDLAGAGISGGGHLVVGSIRYVPGCRDEVLSALIERLGAAPLDHELTSTGSIIDAEE